MRFYTCCLRGRCTNAACRRNDGACAAGCCLRPFCIYLRLVAFAALVVLILAPEALLSASFHLSFAAVVALVVFYDTIRESFELVCGGRVDAQIALYVVGFVSPAWLPGLPGSVFFVSFSGICVFLHSGQCHHHAGFGVHRYASRGAG